MDKIQFFIDPAASSAPKEQPKRRFTADFLFMLSGIYGVLFSFFSLATIPAAGVSVYLVASLITLGAWYTFFQSKKMFGWYLAAAIAVLGLAALSWRDVLPEQAIALERCFYGQISSKPLTELFILLAAAAALLLFCLTFLFRWHVVLYLLTTALLLLSPLISIQVRVESILLLTFFQISFWVRRTAGNVRRGIPLWNEKPRRTPGGFVAGGFLLLFLLAFPFVSAGPQRFYDSVRQAEEFVFQTASRLGGQNGRLYSTGKISGGNLYRTGSELFQLTVIKEPEETLYLSGFQGGEYAGGEWLAADDLSLLVAIEEEHGGNRSRAELKNEYQQLYFEINDKYTGNEYRGLTLRYLGSGNTVDNPYSVYYGIPVGEMERDGKGLEIATYHYFEQKDTEIDWGFNGIIGYSLEQRLHLKRQYAAKAASAYTTVPAEQLPRLTALVEENPLDSLNEITAFILYTLHSNTDYTVSPGRAPLQKDIVEYFLFENAKGYCEHYAATAALMYRMYGIPARYVAGYAVDPAAFQPQGSEYQATVTDELAHAWVEIFLEDYGWTPVEVTPAANGAVTTVYPGFTPEILQQILEEHGWNMNVPSLAHSQGNNREEGGSRIDLEKHGVWFAVFGSLTLFSILLLPLILDYRRLRLLKNMEKMGCRKVFDKLLSLLHFTGLLTDCDGTEEDFAKQLTQAVPVLSQEESNRLIRIVSGAAFGLKIPEEAECDFVGKCYQKTAAYLYPRLSLWQKLRFRYQKAFG